MGTHNAWPDLTFLQQHIEPCCISQSYRHVLKVMFHKLHVKEVASQHTASSHQETPGIAFRDKSFSAQVGFRALEQIKCGSQNMYVGRLLPGRMSKSARPYPQQ